MHAKIIEAWISPEDFRAPGDSDTVCLQKAFAALSDGVNLAFWQDYEITGVITCTASGFAIKGQNRTIRMADGVTQAIGERMLSMFGCSGWSMDELVWDANRDGRSGPHGLQSAPSAVRVMGGSGWAIRKCRFLNAPLDGLYIGALDTGNGPGGIGPGPTDIPTGWVVEDVICEGNWRQGLSIVEGFNGTVRGGCYAYTGPSWDTHFGPGAGIDIEPDNHPDWIQDRIRNILIDNVVFRGNQGFNLLVTGINGVHEITVRDCKFRENGRGAISWSARSGDIIRPVFDGWDDGPYTTNTAAEPKRGLIDIPAGFDTILNIEQPVFRNITADTNDQFGVYIHGTVTGSVKMIDADCDPISIRFWRPHAAGAVIRGGHIRGCSRTPAIYALNDGQIVDGVAVSNFSNVAIDVQGGAGSRVENNILTDPVSNTRGGVIRVRNGFGLDRLGGNKLVRSTPTDGHGIVIDAGGLVTSLLDNDVDGFDPSAGTPYDLNGTVTTSRANRADGVLLTETGIAT